MRRLLILLITATVLLAGAVPAGVVGSPSATAGESTAETAQAAQLAQTQADPTCEYPLTLEDATGEEITIEEEPESVVALQPSDAQTLYEIGAEDKVVGMPVSPYTDYLNASADLDITEDDGVTPVAEEVIDREPDVVLAANALEGDDVIDTLREAGLTVYVFPTSESLDGVAENVRLTGELVGECEGAADTLEWMDERLSVVDEAVPDEDRPLAYYAMGDGYTAGNGTFQDEILTTAGVDNLGADAGIEGWATISEEVVVEEDPEWIVYGDSAEEPPVREAATSTTAYENEQFVAVNDNYMSQPGPRVVLAIEEIASEVHPDAYEEAESDLEIDTDVSTDDNETADNGSNDGSADESDDASNEESGDGSADDAEDEGSSGDSIPGFGAPVAIVGALAVAVLLARRQ
ncbi:PGF-CTERM-anchored ABC transporter substrate-binding protein [Halopiger xanaduensis]|uniref:ABC-type transporter, periplasmic subunit n=1 Tax=Halopiger xanaduensis (strain DSM 18323 / JCM 14033 / SH-6) TaxID=797210 RepID=F8DAD3_HALXS|nr:PGF-CTERM-anchored ABC transporter substrate-binding protein [Halopiger xanaduensis]AEH37958.1 ABC-type transporter, periplasmic subunit [Halopiger xanaduensis SH-6]